MKKYRNKTYNGEHPRILVTEKFVKDNDFKLNKSQKEIAERARSKDDVFGFSMEVIVPYLDWKNGKEFYKDDFVKKVDEGKKKPPKQVTDIYEATQDFLDYMVFGWDKVLGKRGLSASRTLTKLGAWLWLLGRDDLETMINIEDLYNPYGSPALVQLAIKLGIEVPKDLLEFSKMPL